MANDRERARRDNPARDRHHDVPLDGEREDLLHDPQDNHDRQHKRKRDRRCPEKFGSEKATASELHRSKNLIHRQTPRPSPGDRAAATSLQLPNQPFMIPYEPTGGACSCDQDRPIFYRLTLSTPTARLVHPAMPILIVANFVRLLPWDHGA